MRVAPQVAFQLKTWVIRNKELLEKSQKWVEAQPDTIFNVVNKSFGKLYDSSKFTFELSLEKIIFLDDLKVARFNPVFKGDDRSKLENYRPVSVLPCFSNIPKRIMYNGFHKCVLENKILYPKQFGFHVGHLTDHAIIQLDDQIFEAFENNLFTPGVFIDYSKSLRCENFTLKVI